jgi:hypothetical protein
VFDQCQDDAESEPTDSDGEVNGVRLARCARGCSPRSSRRHRQAGESRPILARATRWHRQATVWISTDRLGQAKNRGRDEFVAVGCKIKSASTTSPSSFDAAETSFELRLLGASSRSSMSLGLPA